MNTFEKINLSEEEQKKLQEAFEVIERLKDKVIESGYDTIVTDVIGCFIHSYNVDVLWDVMAVITDLICTTQMTKEPPKGE